MLENITVAMESIIVGMDATLDGELFCYKHTCGEIINVALCIRNLANTPAVNHLAD